jgi:hypothetical protein
VSALLELAERCEQATGPSFALDAAIWCAINDVPFIERRVRDFERGQTPRYTASLDAAMTLAPDGADYAIERVNGEHWASFDADGERMPPVRGATRELATCAAALRARASQDRP